MSIKHLIICGLWISGSCSTYNIDWSWSQFHQQSYRQLFLIALHITLMKPTPGVNFFNILHTAFALVDPKSVKKIDNLTVFFTLLGSASVKAVRRTLMKLSPGVQLFIWSVSFQTSSSRQRYASHVPNVSDVWVNERKGFSGFQKIYKASCSGNRALKLPLYVSISTFFKLQNLWNIIEHLSEPRYSK